MIQELITRIFAAMTLHWKKLLRLLLAFVLVSNGVASNAAMAGHHAAMGKANAVMSGQHEHMSNSHAGHEHSCHEHMGFMPSEHRHDGQTSYGQNNDSQEKQVGTHAANECCQAGACCPAIGMAYQFVPSLNRSYLEVDYDPSFEMVALPGEAEPPRKLSA